MSNIIKIKRGSSVPSTSNDVLEHYELGYRTGTTELYINDGGTYRQVGGGATTSGSNNQLLTDDGSGGITSESSLEFAGQFLTIKGNDPSNTYGVKEKLRIHRSGNNTDRQLQIYEMRHSGGREFLQAFNLDITTDNSSGYTYTQGSYGGSSYIEFDNAGALKFYNDTGVSSGSRNAITPSLSMWIKDDNNILMAGRLGIGWTNGLPARALDVKGGIELSADDNTIDTNNFTLRRGSGGVGHLDSPGNIRLNIDANNNQSNAFFEICANASTTPVFKVGETGTVTTGIWQGSAVGLAYGGTGATSATAARLNLQLGDLAILDSIPANLISSGTIADARIPSTVFKENLGTLTGGTTTENAKATGLYQVNETGHSTLLVSFTGVGGSTRSLELYAHYNDELYFRAGRDSETNFDSVGRYDNKIWHSGNDGANSGLDADTLDGSHASAFLTSSSGLNGSNITSGTIASARLDADTAHLSGTQTFSGNKTFSASMNLGSELNFTGNGNKNIDVETLEGSNYLQIRHHNPVGNAFENAIRFNANGGALIYYNGSNKLETTNTGVSVTGALSVSGALTLGTALAIAEGGTGATSAHNAKINLGLGTLASLSEVDAATIKNNEVGADELNVSGDGTNGQYLASDGAGGFNWLSFVSSTNAGTLDNLDSTQFLRSDTSDTASGNITFTGKLLGNTSTTAILNGGSFTNLNTAFSNDIGTSKAAGLQPFRYSNNSSNTPLGGGGSMANNANWGLSLYSHGTGGSGNYGLQMSGGDNDNQLFFIRRVTNGSFGSWFEMWHSGNDGSGSGLDADKLDGIQASQFIRSDADDSVTGIITFEEAVNMNATDNTERLFFKNNGTTVGDIGSNDTTWLRINQSTNKNIYTPRYIRSDGGFFVDGASQGITGNATFRAPNHSVGNPAYSFSNDTDTGMYLLSGGNLGFSVGGVVRANINSNGINTLNSNGYYIDDRRIYEVTSNSSERGGYHPIVASIRNSGKQRYLDEDFANSINSVNLYNNAGGSNLVVSRITASDDSIVPPNSSGKVVKVAYNGNGTTSPGFGGVYQIINTEKNHTFVQIFQAKLPSGRTFNTAANSMGTGAKDYFLTSPEGTGKWEWYARVCHAGTGGTFSTSGFIYVTGGSDSAFTWYIANMTQYDVTETPGDYVSQTGYYRSNAGVHARLARGLNDDDRIEIEASETKIYGDTVERVRFGSYGIRNGYTGSAGTPSYSFKDDTDSGMYKYDANSLGFSVGGGVRATINSSGVLYVTNAVQAGNGGVQIWDGTHGFKTVLAKDSNYTYLKNNDGTNCIQAGDSGVASSNVYNNDSHIFRTAAGTERWQITSSGTLQGNNKAITGIGGIYGNGGNLTLYNNTYNFKSSTSADLMKLTTTGLGIGTTSPSFKLSVVGGDIHTDGYVRADDGIITHSSASGSVVTLFQNGTYTMLQNPQGNVGLYMGGTGDSRNYYQNTAHRFRNYNNTQHYMEITSAGDVGIGTASPQRKLHVSTGNTDIAARFENTTSNGTVMELLASGDSTTMYFQTDHIYSSSTLHLGIGNKINVYRGSEHRFQVGTGNTEEFRVDSSGSLTTGITRTTDYYQVNKTGSTGSLLKLVNSGWSNATTHDIILNHYVSNLGDYTYLKSAGNSANTHGIVVVADNYIFLGRDNLTTGSLDNSATAPINDVYLRLDANGNGLFDGDVVAFSTTIASDVRLKENVKDLNYGLKDVLDIRPVSFDWKEKRNGQHDIGVIAQEIEKIIPEVVVEVDTLNSEDTHKTVDYAKLTSVLIKAVQEQQQQINKLEEKLNG